MGLLVKFQKDLLFLEKVLAQLPLQNFNKSKKAFYQLNAQLTKEYETRIVFLKKIEKLYGWCLEEEEKKVETISTLNFYANPFAISLFQQKTNKQVTNFLFFLK